MSVFSDRLRKLRNYLHWLLIGRFQLPFVVLDDEKTLQLIMEEGKSIARFGDGEFRIMTGSENGFQSANEALSARLKQVLSSNDPKCLICLPLPFKKMKGLTWKARWFWSSYICETSSEILALTPRKRVYGSATFSRFYMDYTSISHSLILLPQLKNIWANRDLYIIEGKFSKMGCGNDLFQQANSIHRIICPATNAFTKYNQILAAAKELIPPHSLVLLALGMTATVLAYDLSQCGYQAIDIGHIDIEYEWFLARADKKRVIPGKAVNECGVNSPEIALEDAAYRDSIILEV